MLPWMVPKQPREQDNSTRNHEQSARESKGWDTRKGQQSCFLTATRVHGRQRILSKDCTLKSLL